MSDPQGEQAATYVQPPPEPAPEAQPEPEAPPEEEATTRLRVATPFVDSVDVGGVVVTSEGSDVPSDKVDEVRAGAAGVGVNLVEDAQ